LTLAIFRCTLQYLYLFRFSPQCNVPRTTSISILFWYLFSPDKRSQPVQKCEVRYPWTEERTSMLWVPCIFVTGLTESPTNALYLFM
jgi:hypothetical protein